MTTERDFDRLARAWLDLGPDEAPDRVVAAVLQAAETEPQARRPIQWPIWRAFSMNRLPVTVAALATVVIALAGAFLITRPSASTGGPSATPTASPSASSAAVPDELRYRWMGESRDILGAESTTRQAVLFGPSTVGIVGTAYQPPGILPSEVSLPSPELLRLVLTADQVGCQIGDVGAYGWSLSPGGTVLTIEPGSDACAARAVAVPGTWFREHCTNTENGCLGDLEGGTYPSQYIDPRLVVGETWAPKFGAMTYTVPDGWSNSSDWPATFSLTPASDYALETADGPPPETFHGIWVFARPAATAQNATCANAEQAAVGTSVAALIDWVRSQPSVVTTAPTPITIGGLSGQWIDIKVAPTWTETCPDSQDKATAIYLSESGNDAQGWSLYVQGTEQQRLILLDLGSGDTLALAIDSTHPDRYQDLLTQAMPIIESFTFK